MNKPLKLNVDKYVYIGCIPVEVHPEHPGDQSPCIKADCPHCKESMWVSERKRQIKAKIGKSAKIYCLKCIAIACMEQGITPELCDIGKIN